MGNGQGRAHDVVGLRPVSHPAAHHHIKSALRFQFKQVARPYIRVRKMRADSANRRVAARPTSPCPKVIIRSDSRNPSLRGRRACVHVGGHNLFCANEGREIPITACRVGLAACVSACVSNQGARVRANCGVSKRMVFVEVALHQLNLARIRNGRAGTGQVGEIHASHR